MTGERNTQYAAYGEMEAILPILLGRELGPGRFAVLENIELCTQQLADVTDEIAPDAPAPLSPHKILSENWDSSFSTYVARETADTASQVPARIFEITEAERALILEDWNLSVFGWFDDLRVCAQPLSGGQKLQVVTDIIMPGQTVRRLYTGKAAGSLQRLLKPRGDLEAAARAVRAAYLERKA